MARRGQLFVCVCACTVTATVVYLSTSSYSSHGGGLQSIEAPREEKLWGPLQQWNAMTGTRPAWNCSGSGQMTQTSVRDILTFAPWPEKQPPVYLPGLIPPVVHYVWCGNKKFRFHDYLSVLSAIKLIRPLKLVLHYTHLPQTDSYNTWFEELKSSVAGLELQELPPNLACGSRDLLRGALGALASHGGVLVSGNVILSRFPRQLTQGTSSFFAFAPNSAKSTLGVVFAKSGFDEATKNSYLETIDKISPGSCNDNNKPSKSSSSSCCVTIMDYNNRPDDAVCVTLTDAIHPRDVIEARTPFAELARWLFYGNRAPSLPTQDFGNLIPRISHFIRLKGSRKPEDQGMYKEVFSFNHMLNILSALYVAGFEQVFVHLEGEEPTGRWWEEIKKEKNVTVLKALRPSTVYQHKVEVVQHVSDVLRYLTVYTYGGAYQDFDVTWYTRVPDSLLAYPAVAGLEWEQKDKEWPESFNLGVFLARPGAEWFRHYIDTHKDFKDRDWGFNSLKMSYKTYELYPHLLLLDRKLQVICCYGKCHPAWERNYQHSGVPDNLPTMPSSWQEVRAVHVTCPKPHPSLSSPEAIKQRTDMMAEIGRNVLNKSGRQYLLT